MILSIINSGVEANWPHVWMVTLIGFGLTFVLLILLVYLMRLFGVIMKPRVKVPKVVKNDNKMEIKHDEKSEVTLSANTTAAIAMALHLYYDEMHDEEQHVITIKNVERRYSPWNSKIYGINNLVK
jgi:glutaconyl-CoA/methylmalonyl-CoA decarboxylase subunit delta